MPDGIYALADPSSRITTINFNNQFDLFGLKTCLTGRSFENFPMIDDAPAEKELPKQGSWLLNLVVGVLVTAALVAVAIVAAPAVAVIAAGAAVGAAVVTVAVAVADYGGEARSFGEFLGQLAMGVGLGALAGAMIYGLVVAAPIVAEAFGIQAAIWGGGASTFTVSTLPFMTKLGVFGLAGLQGLNMVNDCVTIGYGQNFLLDYVFGGNVSNYETAVMLMHFLSYGSMQVAVNNAGLAKPRGMPTTRAGVHQDLLKKGYRCNGTSKGGYVTYMHPDGRRVDIRPNGEVISTQKSWLPDGSRKITERFYYDGTKVPDGGHNTGEFVEPIGTDTVLPPKPN